MMWNRNKTFEMNPIKGNFNRNEQSFGEFRGKIL